MRIPNLGAFDGRAEEYEWTRIEPKPAPVPAPPSLPRMTISSVPITAEELAENVQTYVEELTDKPGWQDELAKKNLAAKEARKLARKQKQG